MSEQPQQKERKGFASPLQKAQSGRIGGGRSTEMPIQEDTRDRPAVQEHQLPSTPETPTSKQKREETHFRQTVWMPIPLATRLKVHAARTRQDISGIVVKLVEQYLDSEEDR